MRHLVWLTIFLVLGCEAKNVEITPEEVDLISELGFDLPLMSEIRNAGEYYERLVGTSEEFEQIPVDGIALATKPERGRSALQKVRSIVNDTQYSAYLNEESYGFGPDKLAIIKSKDDYAYLAMVRTDGINYDIRHEQVIAQYRKWDDRLELSLNGAGLDWLDAKITSPPDDWLALAQEVYQFCPDVVDQGTGSVSALASEMSNSKTLYLWWD